MCVYPFLACLVPSVPGKDSMTLTKIMCLLKVSECVSDISTTYGSIENVKFNMIAWNKTNLCHMRKTVIF